jgi:predicted Rossmann fold nucleotide-binding protein DprA/Smf involved in DNA uptake
MNINRINQNDPFYPSALKKYLGASFPVTLTATGNLDILQGKTLAVFCSNKCPGNIILKTYDLLRQIRERGITVISGFHSAIERECLNILLRGKQSVIICPARSIEGMRIKPEYKKPLEDGRLLILSPFAGKEKRISLDRAIRRNYFLAALATDVLIPYAAPGSKTETFCRELLKWGKRVYTTDDEKNTSLIETGIKTISPEIFDKWYE